MQHEHAAIDIVITWVDGDDETWRESRAKYKFLETGQPEPEVRFRDYGTLRYVFRSIEMYAPWIRKIHLVTCGQKPAWLNTEHPKLHMVDHRDYIPGEYLPTFSSHTIELNFHRMEDLAEQFIYFNDDTLLAAPTEPTDFFRDGKPCDAAVLTPVIGTVPGDAFAHYLLNNVAVVNAHFNLRSVLRGNLKNWFNPRYGVYNVRNILFSAITSWVVGFKNFHMPAPMLKSTFPKVWDLEPEMLDKTCRNKFRGLNDISPYIMSYYNFCTNNFVPRSPKYGRYLDLGHDPRTLRDAVSGRYKYITINDVSGLKDYNAAKIQLQEVLEAAFPKKSSFEL